MKRIFLFVLLASCATPGPVQKETLPAWNGTLFVGDAEHGAIVRSQSTTSISATDPKFNGMICMSYIDFTDLMIQLKFLRSRESGGSP